MTLVEKPRVPFEIPIPGGVCPGKHLRIEGTVPQSSIRFDVNLLCQNGDIALNVAPKFRENYVATNNVQHMTWGQEERKGPLPIYAGQNFELLIVCEESDYKIVFNGEYFTQFNHRVPFTKISDLGVEGEVIVHAVHFDESDGNHVKYSASTSSYGFQPGAPSSPYSNSGAGLYPSVPSELPPDPRSTSRGSSPSAPSYPQGPAPFPTSGPGYSTGPDSYPPSRPNYPQAPGSYPSSGPNYPQVPGSYPSSGPGYPQAPGSYPSSAPGYPQAPGSYPSAGPNYPQAPGSYPPPGSNYPQVPGSYPSSGPSYPQGPSQYPQNPNYGQGPYPQMPDQGSYGGKKHKSSKPSFLSQAGMALAGVLGPALLAKGLKKHTNTNTNTNTQNQGGPDFLGQAAGTLAGILGGSGLSGYGHYNHNMRGALGTAIAGAALTGHLNPIKAAKKQRKAQKKALKYGIPIAGAGLSAYALHKGLKKGFRRSSSSSSCSSSD